MLGMVIPDRADADCALFYELVLNTDWTVRSVMLRSDTGMVKTLSRESSGRWEDHHGPREDLAGCIDIDISGSPATNTLPIRRITDWTIGQERQFSMAYLALPGLEFFRHDQVYARLSDTRFLYRNADGSFEAVLTVDEEGFVIDYPPLFKRV